MNYYIALVKIVDLQVIVYVRKKKGKNKIYISEHASHICSKWVFHAGYRIHMHANLFQEGSESRYLKLKPSWKETGFFLEYEFSWAVFLSRGKCISFLFLNFN